MTEPSSATSTSRAARPYAIAVGGLFLVVVYHCRYQRDLELAAGLGGLSEGDPLPRFAAPAATGTSRRGRQHQSRTTPAVTASRAPQPVEVEGPPAQVVRICDFFDRPLVMVAWFTRGCGTCRSQLDTVEKVRKRFPKWASSDWTSGSRRKTREHECASNGWRFPMAVDRDGAVSNLYRVGVGPLTFFAYPGGISMDTGSGSSTSSELVTRVRRAGTRVRATGAARRDRRVVRSARGRSRRSCARSFRGSLFATTVVEAKPGRSPPGVKTHLRYLSNRFYGHRALNLRREPIASSYRVFYRQIGLDPDEFRTPIEAASLERLRAGGFKSHGLVEDAVTIGIVETGVADARARRRPDQRSPAAAHRRAARSGSGARSTA